MPVSKKPTKKPAQKSAQAFPFIKRDDANKAVTLPLFSDDSGVYYLEIISAYSDKFKTRKAAIFRDAAMAMTDGKFTDEKQQELTAKLAASTIVNWKLPEQFGDYTHEKAEQLLIDYPQILESVDDFSSDNDNFIKKN